MTEANRTTEIAKAARIASLVFREEDWEWSDGKRLDVPTQDRIAAHLDRLVSTAEQDGASSVSSGRLLVTTHQDEGSDEREFVISIEVGRWEVA